MVQSTRVLVVAEASTADTVLENVPAALGLPLMTPVVALMASPGGKALARYDRLPRYAVALMASTTGAPTVPLFGPGLTSFGAASPVMRIVFATDGTPLAFIANSM